MADAPEELAILAAGAPPTHPVPLAHLRSADVLVCCDGAYAVARRLGREADSVVGDGDSLSVDDRSRLEGRFVHVSEQDTNDLAKAFRFAVTCRPRRIVILGATGLREDHALGNIFWLFDFVEAFPSTCICTDPGTFEVVASERTFACSPGTAVSVFVPDREARVASKGLAWPLDGVRFTDLHCATLNRAVDASFTLAPTRPALVYIAHGVSTVWASASSVA
jgi:thiamine pyrophosphokinase